MDLNVGPVGIDFKAEKRNSIDFPFDIDVVCGIDFEAYQAGVEDSFSLDINVGGITLDFEAEAFTLENKYFYMNFDVGPVGIDFEAVKVIQAPNLLPDNVNAVEMPITIPIGDTQESELSKYKAVGNINGLLKELVFQEQELVMKFLMNMKFLGQIESQLYFLKLHLSYCLLH